MRPAGEVRQALLEAAQAFVSDRRAPTLVELAHRSQVGLEAARRTVNNMTRAGHLVIVGERRVPYRNRPVAEYAPPRTLAPMVLDVRPLRDVVNGWSATAIA